MLIEIPRNINAPNLVRREPDAQRVRHHSRHDEREDDAHPARQHGRALLPPQMLVLKFAADQEKKKHQANRADNLKRLQRAGRKQNSRGMRSHATEHRWPNQDSTDHFSDHPRLPKLARYPAAEQRSQQHCSHLNQQQRHPGPRSKFQTHPGLAGNR